MSSHEEDPFADDNAIISTVSGATQGKQKKRRRPGKGKKRSAVNAASSQQAGSSELVSSLTTDEFTKAFPLGHPPMGPARTAWEEQTKQTVREISRLMLDPLSVWLSKTHLEAYTKSLWPEAQKFANAQSMQGLSETRWSDLARGYIMSALSARHVEIPPEVLIESKAHLDRSSLTAASEPGTALEDQEQLPGGTTSPHSSEATSTKAQEGVDKLTDNPRETGMTVATPLAHILSAADPTFDWKKLAPLSELTQAGGSKASTSVAETIKTQSYEDRIASEVDAETVLQNENIYTIMTQHNTEALPLLIRSFVSVYGDDGTKSAGLNRTSMVTDLFLHLWGQQQSIETSETTDNSDIHESGEVLGDA